jgi:hypothetical protein
MYARSTQHHTQGGTPLLRHGTPTAALPDGGVEVTYLLDSTRDLYLIDHRIDGRPVLPMAVALELMAEVVVSAWPALRIARISRLRVLQGVKLERLPSGGPYGQVEYGTYALTVTARPIAAERSVAHSHVVEVTISGAPAKPGLPRRLHFRCTIALANRLPAPPPVAVLPLEGALAFPLSVEDAYAHWLFHGPLLEGILAVNGIGADGITATLVSSVPDQLMVDPGQGSWQVDPVMVDSVFQLISLWTRHTHDMSALPTFADTYRWFAPLDDAPVRCEVRLSPTPPDSPSLYADAWLIGTSGRLLALIEHIDVTAHRDLNRLTGMAARAL